MLMLAWVIIESHIGQLSPYDSPTTLQKHAIMVWLSWQHNTCRYITNSQGSWCFGQLLQCIVWSKRKYPLLRIFIQKWHSCLCCVRCGPLQTAIICEKTRNEEIVLFLASYWIHLKFSIRFPNKLVSLLCPILLFCWILIYCWSWL